jgi:hypothetical protein
MKLILIATSIISVCIVVLAIIGLIEKRKERKFLTKFNEESIDSYMSGVEKKKRNAKHSRKSTPKVPTIKK